MATQGYHETNIVPGVCDGAVTKYRAVIIGSDADSYKMPTGANQDVKAIAVYTRADGEANAFAMGGSQVKCEFGAACAYGARVYADANGKAITVPTGTTGTTQYHSFGWNKSSDIAADGDIGIVVLDFSVMEA